MKLTRCELTNFGSYKHLEFDFSEAGLALVYGPTGAGKSALLDAAVWVLYGQTAKGGAVDDVKSWQTESAAVTSGDLDVSLPAGKIRVSRKRGKAGSNDCYWREQENEDGDSDSFGPPRRGKDLADTQKLLEARLGVYADRFLASAYFHEFSQTGSFFVSKAKDRRAVLEGLADLSLPAQVVEGCKSHKRAAKERRGKAEEALAGLEGALRANESAREHTLSAAASWTIEHTRSEYILAAKIEYFEKDKIKEVADLKAKEAAWEEKRKEKAAVILARCDYLITEPPPEAYVARIAEYRNAPRCGECGAAKHHELIAELERHKAAVELDREKERAFKAEVARESKATNPFTAAVAAALSKENHYTERLKELKDEVNPHIANVSAHDRELARLKREQKKIDKEISHLSRDISDLDELCDISLQLRATLLQNIVSRIERDTNKALETHFDGEFRVSFSLTDDALDTEISKNGYSCNYKQLSKGQRSLLRLCFVVAVMKATADTLTTPTRHAFFDEALDGLDATLKTKAFGLIEELNQVREHILVVEHDPGFQSLFHEKYRVELVGDHSELTRE